jgi:hypothetical protein
MVTEKSIGIVVSENSTSKRKRNFEIDVFHKGITEKVFIQYTNLLKL